MEVSKDLTVLNGTIIGGLIVTGGTVTVSGGDVGVKGPINITNNASVTISGSTRAVESTSKANVTLYGSTEVDGETSEEASFNDNTYYIDNEVAKKLSTEQVGQAPTKEAITLTEPEQVDGYVIPYGYAGMTVSIAMEVSFRDTVSEDNPATVTYYVDGKEFATETWESEQEAEEFIYLDDIFAACPVGIHTACVKLTYQGTSLTSKTYTATVVKSGTRISANTWRGGNPETTFDYGETFTVSVSVEPTGMSTYSAETEPAENYVVVCDEQGREISERDVYDGYGNNLTVDTQDLGAGEHTLTVNYVGCNEMDSATNTVDVTVEKSGLSVVSSADYTYNKSFTGKPIPNPTAAQLTILNSSTQERVDSASVYDKIEFEWYAATKTYDNRIGEYLYGKISDTPIDGTPIDAGDYILDVNFPETDNYCSSSSNINLTVNKTQDLGAGQSVICPVDVKLSSDEATYTVDLAKCLEDNHIRTGGALAVNNDYFGIGQSEFVKSATFENGELTIIMKSLDVVQRPGSIGRLSVNLTSRNYTVIPMELNLMAQGEHIDVKMPSWTYGETAQKPDFLPPADAGDTDAVITYAKIDGTPLNEKPSDVGKYRVTVSYSTANTIYSGSADFEITPAPITADMVALEQNQLTFLPNADYSSGVEQTQGVTVTWKDQPLADANYTLTGNTATDAGTYTLTVAGTGNFTGTVEKTWTVAPLPVGFDLDGDIRKDYDGTDAADVSISDWHVEGSSAPTTFQLPDNLYTVTGAAYDSAEAGEGKTVQFTVTLNENYAFSDGSRSKAFSSADFPGVTAAINKEQKPVNPYNPGSVWLQAGLDQMGYLTLDYFRKINANLPADAEITAVQLNEGSVSGVIDHLSVLDGMVSYDIAHNAPAGSKVNCTVTISSRNCDYLYTVSFYPEEQLVPRGRPTLSRDTLTYGEKLGDITISGNLWDSEKNPIDGRFSWDYPEATPEVGSYTTNWTFTSYDDAYLPFIDGTVTITVNKITLDSTPKFTLISTSGKTLADAGLAAASDWPEGTLTWDLPLETTVAANTAYGWTFTPADTAHYETATGTIVLYPVSGGGGSGGGGGGGRPSTPAAPSTPTTPTTPDVPSTPEQPFTDVSPEDWFYDAVTWAKGAGITGGVSQDRFGSGDPCTRGQIVTFLWRAAGSPAPKGQADMTDVPADAYYSTAVAWAVENGIASGTGANLFSPDASCTRAQAVTFLWRAAGSPAAQGGADFHDVTDGDYFAQAVAWANEHDITDGVGGGLFGSMDSCTRSQIVTFLFMAR